MAVLIGQSWSRQYLIIASGPDVSHGVVLSGFMRLVGRVTCFHESGAET